MALRREPFCTWMYEGREHKDSMTPAKSSSDLFGIGCGLLSHAAAAPDIVPVGSKVELVARTQAAQATPFTEGPVYRDGHIYFTDTSNSRILRVRVDRQAALPLPLEIFREPSGTCQWIGV